MSFEQAANLTPSITFMTRNPKEVITIPRYYYRPPVGGITLTWYSVFRPQYHEPRCQLSSLFQFYLETKIIVICAGSKVNSNYPSCAANVREIYSTPDPPPN